MLFQRVKESKSKVHQPKTELAKQHAENSTTNIVIKCIVFKKELSTYCKLPTSKNNVYIVYPTFSHLATRGDTCVCHLCGARVLLPYVLFFHF